MGEDALGAHRKVDQGEVGDWKNDGAETGPSAVRLKVGISE